MPCLVRRTDESWVPFFAYGLRQGEPWRDVLADAGQMDLGELYWLGVFVALGHSWPPRNGHVPYTDAPAILDALIAQMQQRPDLTRHHRLNLAELLHLAGRGNEARSIVDAALNPRNTASQIGLMGKLFGGENPRFEETLRKAFDEESAKGVPHYTSLNGYVRDALDAERLVVLEAAADTMSSRDLASLRARFAWSITYFGDLSEHRDLAVSHLRDAIEFQKTDRSPNYRTARVIFDAAVRLDLPDIVAHARQEMGRAALHSDSTLDLADAAQVFHRAESAAR